MLQSNWICKCKIDVPINISNINYEEMLPSGRLRCIRIEQYPGGANNRMFYFRSSKFGVVAFFSTAILVGGFSDWVSVWNIGAGDDNYFYLDCLSKGAIPFMYRGTAPADGHPLQLSFWYEPEDGDDDSHLAPLSVGRGGETRT